MLAFSLGPILVPIILVVWLVKRQNKKHKEAMEAIQGGNFTVNDDPFSPTYVGGKSVYKPPKPRDPNAGLNWALYAGSLMVVAAAAAFVGLTPDIPDVAKFFGVLIVVSAFYGIGLGIRKDKRFHIAGDTFVGTGLALIPFLGLAFGMFTGIKPEHAWLITSVIALGAYIYATIVLNSRVVAYLSMVVVISLAASMSASFQLGLIYMFLFVMIVGLAAAIIQLFAPKIVPKIFSEPIEITARILTPFTLVASLFVAWDTNSWFYVVLTGVAAAQYGLVWWKKRTITNEMVMRLLVHTFVLVLSYNIVDKDLIYFGIIFLIVAAAHAATSLIITYFATDRNKLTTFAERVNGELPVFVISNILLLLSFGFFESTHVQVAPSVFITSGFIAMMLFGLAIPTFKRWGFAYAIIALSIATTSAFGGWLARPTWPAENYLGIYLPLMLACLVIAWLVKGAKQEIRNIPLVGLLIYGFISIIISSVSNDVVWQISTAAVIALSFITYGLILNKKLLTELGSYAFAYTMVRLVGAMELQIPWETELVIDTYFFAIALAAMSFWRERKLDLRPRLIIAAVIVTAVTGFLSLGGQVVWQIFFLVEMALFIVAGVTLSIRWLWIWGIVGIILSVLWSIRDNTWLALLLIGLGLIGFVVFMLARKKPDDEPTIPTFPTTPQQ